MTALRSVLCACLLAASAAGGLPAASQEKPAASAPDPAAPGGKSKNQPKPFSEVIEEAERIDGLFTFYQGKRGEVWLEAGPEILDRPLFLEVTAATGLGGDGGGAATGDPLYDAIFELHRVFDTVQMRVKQTRFRAPAGHPVARSIERSFGPSVLAAMKVESQPHPERGTVLVDAGDLLLGDLALIAKALTRRLKSTFTVDKKKSYVARIRSFAHNAEVNVAYNLNTDKPVSVDTLADGRTAEVTLRYSFIRLPESDYRPRVADPRVGYFTTAFQDLSEDDPVQPHTRHILRWNIRKNTPGAAVSAAAEPLVFWLDNAIPVAYRDAVRDGLLAWNVAFEKLGIKDAIQVKQIPDGEEMDPFDIRFNVVRWATSPGDAYAVALFRENPITGQIINASIRMDASIVSVTRRSFRLQDELKGFTGAAEIPSPERARLCDYSRQGIREAAAAFTALELARGPMNEAERRTFVRQYITEVIAHEMGHILGLRHNFKASTLYDLSELHDTAKTARTGVTASVMDYAPPNLAAPGEKQGDYFSTVIGPYDIWAIEYGYGEAPAQGDAGAEEAYLKRIAARSTEPGLAYATDEDVSDWGYAAYSSDPMASRWDLGRDPLAYARKRALMMQALWDRLEKQTPPHGRTYQDTLDKFRLLLDIYLGSFRIATRFIGGVHTTRSLPGDPSAPAAPLIVAPADRQREALIYIRTRLFDQNALQFKPSLLTRLAPDKNIDWARNSYKEEQLYSPLERVLLTQRSVLRWLFNPGLLTRLRDNEARVDQPSATLTTAELFSSVTGGVFSELRARGGGAVKIDSPLRRELQREAVKVLTDLYLQGGRAPADAEALAFAHLRVLRDEIRAALQQAGAMEIVTRAHLEQQQQRIERVLEARIALPGG